MHDDATLAELIREHCRRMSSGDVDHMLELYTADVRFEDPVGSPPLIGHAALRTHFTRAAQSRTYDIPGTPVVASDGRHVAMPVTVQMNYLPLGPTLVEYGYLEAPANPRAMMMTMNVVGVIRANADALIEAAWIYWGRSDVDLMDSAAALALREQLTTR